MIEGYKPSPTILTGGTGTGNIKQHRRIRPAGKRGRGGRRRKKRRIANPLKRLGVL